MFAERPLASKLELEGRGDFGIPKVTMITCGQASDIALAFSVIFVQFDVSMS